MVRRKKIFSFAITLFSFLILGLWFVGFNNFCDEINRYTTVATQKNEAIVVLTGGRHRIEQGIELLLNNKANVLFISGVSAKTTIDDLLSKAHINVELKNKIELGYMATTTVENALEIKDWIVKNNIKSMYLVTSNYHIPRSLAELSVLNLPVDVYPYPVYSEKIATQWWKSGDTFAFLAKEYNKYLYVCLRNFMNF